ncbi:unnamed protein product [Pleuronectes platessa]|uniref:Uncharacterized protein n=1 Tax=Pleuronectes platessa TaxID=8262 RepID=A0A9N7U8A9_PLEPL|nr:unnamed protein product [Pleuronectes platessa]
MELGFRKEMVDSVTRDLTGVSCATPVLPFWSHDAPAASMAVALLPEEAGRSWFRKWWMKGTVQVVRTSSQDVGVPSFGGLASTPNWPDTPRGLHIPSGLDHTSSSPKRN